VLQQGTNATVYSTLIPKANLTLAPTPCPNPNLNPNTNPNFNELTSWVGDELTATQLSLNSDIGAALTFQLETIKSSSLHGRRENMWSLIDSLTKSHTETYRRDHTQTDTHTTWHIRVVQTAVGSLGCFRCICEQEQSIENNYREEVV